MTCPQGRRVLGWTGDRARLLAAPAYDSGIMRRLLAAMTRDREASVAAAWQTFRDTGSEALRGWLGPEPGEY
jgi:hypothetical protein